MSFPYNRFNRFKRRYARGYYGSRGIQRPFGRSLANYGTYSTGIVELKYVDVDNQATDITSTPYHILLNGIAAGDDNTQRDGRQCVMKSVLLKGWLEPASGSVLNQEIRILVVYDSQCNSADLTTTDLLKSNTVNSNINLNNRGRFKIIFDKHIVMGAFDTTTAGQAAPIASAPTIKHITLYRKMMLPIVFSGVGATYASISMGALWLVMMSTTGTGDCYVFSYSTRVRFVDH